VPSIRDIQQILVDLGDKNKPFVGSSEWIGSMEVSFVLNAHLDVTCRIMSLRQGDTLNSVCLELSEHFDRHGTPVMIGNRSNNSIISSYYIYLCFRRWSTCSHYFRSRHQ